MDVLNFSKQENMITDTYVQLIDDHIGILKNMIQETKPITGNKDYSYVGDFYGMLTALGIDKKYHYGIMKVNGIESSDDFNTDVTAIDIPSLSYMDSLLEVAKSKLKNKAL